ncbi:GrpB family protein [soil metagenome]
MIKIVPYRESWPERFASFGARLRTAAGADALAIHHIGSTSVSGLAAKDIIDVQVTVADFALPFRAAFEDLGLNFRPIERDHCPPGMDVAPEGLEKRYFSSESPHLHVHIRIQNHFNQRYALICRDYLRTHPMAANAYAEIKHQLARYFPNDVDAYYDIKDPVFDVIMAGGHLWAEATNWQQPPTDA